jgi:hypothetical protein
LTVTTEELKSELSDTKILDTGGFYGAIGQRPDLYLSRSDMLERLETKRLVVNDGRVKVRNTYRALGVWKGASVNVEGPYGSNLLDLTWQLVAMCTQENHAPEIGVGFWKKMEALAKPVPLKSTWVGPPAPAKGYAGYVTRVEWGAHSPKTANSTNVRNGYVKAHWTVGCQNGPHSNCAKHVQGIQDYHMNSNGWNDIAYGEIICPHGFVFCGRGPGMRSAANGNGQLNYDHEAISLIGGPDCQPTIVQRDALYARMDERGCIELKGHRDNYSTECPGDKIYGWVKSYKPVG